MPTDNGINKENGTPEVVVWQTAVSNENPELLKRAREECVENLDCRDEVIQELRELVLAEDDLTTPTDDAFLLRFLRVYKFDIIQAFKLLQHYYRMRVKYPDLFAYYRPSSIVNALNENLLIMLPQRDELGRRILLIKCGLVKGDCTNGVKMYSSTGKWDPAKSTSDECLLATHMCVDGVLTEEETQVNGIVVLLDMKKFGMTQGRHGTLSTIKKYATVFHDCLPARFKGFHFIFESPVFDILFMVIKPFLSREAKSLTCFHGNSLKSLHEHIRPEFLPEEYGGMLPSADTIGDLQTQDFFAHDDEIASNMSNYGYGVKKP